MFDRFTVIEKGIDVAIPIRLVDSVDLVTGETGKAHGDVTVKLTDGETGTINTITIASGDWVEIDDGDYWLTIGAGTNEFDAYGTYRLTVESSGCQTYRVFVTVGIDATTLTIGNSENLFTQVRRIHATGGGTTQEIDPDAAERHKTLCKDEAGTSTLITLTNAVSGDNVMSVTPS